MKKTLAIVLSLVMVLAIAVPAFAAHFDLKPEAPFFDGMPINPRDYDNNTNLFRNQHTPSRCFDNIYSSAVVMNETGNYFKWVGPTYLYNDGNDMDNGGNIEVYQTTMKRGETINAAAGYVFAYSYEGVVQDGVTLATEYRVANSEEKFAANNGFGFTFLKDSKSKIRFYVMYLGEVVDNAAPVQVMYADYDTGVDLTKDYHDYKLYYRSALGAGGDGEALFFFDDVTVAKITFSEAVEYSFDIVAYNEDGTTTSTFAKLGKKYAKNLSFYGPDGKLVGSTTSSLISPNSGNFALTVCGTGDELYTTYHFNDVISEMPAENFKAPVTGDNFAIYAVVAVVAVAAIGSAVVVRRKKETQF